MGPNLNRYTENLVALETPKKSVRGRSRVTEKAPRERGRDTVPAVFHSTRERCAPPSSKGEQGLRALAKSSGQMIAAFDRLVKARLR